MTESRLAKELRNARPSLRKVSPLSHWIMVTLGVFNLILGTTLFLALDSKRFTASLLVVNDVMTYQFWGIIFFALGILKLYSVFANKWELSKKTLLAGVALKATWAIALTIRTFISPGTIFVDLIWITLAIIQVGCYFYFAPTVPQSPLTRKQ